MQIGTGRDASCDRLRVRNWPGLGRIGQPCCRKLRKYHQPDEGALATNQTCFNQRGLGIGSSCSRLWTDLPNARTLRSLGTSILSSASLQRCQHQFEPACSKSSRGIVAWSTLLPGDLPRGDLRGAASSEAGARRRQRDRGGVLRAGAVRKRSSSTIASASRARRSCLACSMPGGRRFALSRASRAISSNRSPNDIVCLTRRRRFF